MTQSRENNENEGASTRPKVAIQGYEGCFHQVAGYGFLGQDITIVPCDTFREVTRLVKQGSADTGVMAIENSIAGSILPNYSLLQDDSLRIIGEVYLSITQHLLALPGVSPQEITEVQSHPMAILQCLDYLDNCGRKLKLVETEDTALSVKHIAENRLRHVAGIAGELAAELYGLEIIAPGINTIKNNYTRFLIIRHADNAQPVDDANKASVYFKVEHRRGSLLQVLRSMEKNNLNMTKLQSYPIPADPFNYLFHMDVEFNRLEDFNAVVEHMKDRATDIRVCGIYKTGKVIK